MKHFLHLKDIPANDLKKITVEKFSNGYLKNPWIGNCCAIGNSAVCIEPLEETECGVAINQTFLLMHYLTNVNYQI